MVAWSVRTWSAYIAGILCATLVFTESYIFLNVPHTLDPARVMQEPCVVDFCAPPLGLASSMLCKASLAARLGEARGAEIDFHATPECIVELRLVPGWGAARGNATTLAPSTGARMCRVVRDDGATHGTACLGGPWDPSASHLLVRHRHFVMAGVAVLIGVLIAMAIANTY